jgi:hypothetical protein
MLYPKARKRCRLGVDALVIILSNISTRRAEQLIDLSVDNRHQRPGEQIHHGQGSGLGCQVGGAGEHVIAGQDRGPGRPLCIQGRDPAAEKRTVDQVVVHQRGRVEHLNRRRQCHRPVVIGAQHSRSQECDRRADALASRGEKMFDCRV